MAILVPFELLFLYVVRHEPPVLTMIALVGMLLTPPFLAAFVAVTVGRSNPDASNAYGLTPFVATRPLSTAALVAVKLRMALASTLFAWLLVLVAVPLGITVAGRWPVVVEEARGLTDFFGAPRAIVVALLFLLGLLAATWKQLVQGLAIGLTGREGLIKSSVLIRLSSLVLIGLGRPPPERQPGRADLPVERRALDPGRTRSSSRCAPRPGSPPASIATGCSATARS